MERTGFWFGIELVFVRCTMVWDEGSKSGAVGTGEHCVQFGSRIAVVRVNKRGVILARWGDEVDVTAFG